MEEPELIGEWSRQRVLGCGGFGVVTLWENNNTEELVAIKKYRGDNDNLTNKHKERWKQEVEMMQRIKNENIVGFKELPSDFEQELSKYNPSKLPMLSMEYCTQGDLRSVLTRSENCCGLRESDVRYILHDLLNAVSYLHSLNITHRDLKPENIVLQTYDRPNLIIYKLIDLGYAKELDAKSICASFVGTLQYLAPELLYSKTYSCSVDYWSMGLVAFEVICGTRPFLPNKSPAQWMYHVHKKSHDIICIYEENESVDSVKSAKEIFAENHVSSCFKSEIEKWLQLALEYNPRQRGYQNCESEGATNSTLVFFSFLKELLEKKIITVFSVFTCEFLSYEIDECTQVSTLQGWIELDTKIGKAEQVLLSNICETIDLQGVAFQFYDETYLQPMLYVYKKNEVLSCDIKPKFIPLLVKEMLYDASKDMQYYFQKRSYAHALYFIYNETNIYNTLLDACNLKIKSIIKACDYTNQVCRTMHINVEKLIAQKEFSKCALNADFAQYVKNFSQQPNHWVDSFNIIADRIDKLYELCNKMKTRQESLYRRTTTTSVYFNKEFSKHNNHSLNEVLEKALACYSRLRSRCKEDRAIRQNCKDMAKLLYDVLKSRDKLLRDTTFKNYLMSLVAFEKELEKMLPALNSSVDHIENFRQELLADHKNRQDKIWEFTIKPKQKPKNTDSTTSKSPGHSKSDNIKSSIESHKNERMSTNVDLNRTDVQNSLWNSDEKKTMSLRLPTFQIGQPASDMIDHNLNLRHELEEKTMESFMKYKSIVTEELDFSFLH